MIREWSCESYLGWTIWSFILHTMDSTEQWLMIRIAFWSIEDRQGTKGPSIPAMYWNASKPSSSCTTPEKEAENHFSLFSSGTTASLESPLGSASPEYVHISKKRECRYWSSSSPAGFGRHRLQTTRRRRRGMKGLCSLQWLSWKYAWVPDSVNNHVDILRCTRP